MRPLYIKIIFGLFITILEYLYLECWSESSDEGGEGLSSGARGLGLAGAGSSWDTWDTTELSMEPQPGSHPGNRDSTLL